MDFFHQKLDFNVMVIFLFSKIFYLELNVKEPAWVFRLLVCSEAKQLLVLFKVNDPILRIVALE